MAVLLSQLPIFQLLRRSRPPVTAAQRPDGIDSFLPDETNEINEMDEIDCIVQPDLLPTTEQTEWTEQTEQTKERLAALIPKPESRSPVNAISP